MLAYSLYYMCVSTLQAAVREEALNLYVKIGGVCRSPEISFFPKPRLSQHNLSNDKGDQIFSLSCKIFNIHWTKLPIYIGQCVYIS
jgi:hypothetical protein